MKYAWVKFKCGCCEGIWIDESTRCRDCGAEVIEASMKVELKPPEDFEIKFSPKITNITHPK